MGEWSAAARAQWLAQLRDALDEAQKVLRRNPGGRDRHELGELLGRIDAARFEVRAMQLRNQRRADRENDPKRRRKSP